MWLSALLTIIIQLLKDVIPNNLHRYIPLISILLWVGAVYFLWDFIDYKDLFEQWLTYGLWATWVYQLSKWLIEVADWQTKQELVYKIQDEIKNDQKSEISTKDMPISYENLPPDYPYYETTETSSKSI